MTDDEIIAAAQSRLEQTRKLSKMDPEASTWFSNWKLSQKWIAEAREQSERSIARLNIPDAAIPTKYAGVQFRSRLEARHAAYWDLIEQAWKYEPLDLHGYIPDFLIETFNPRAPLILVEIKPGYFTEGWEEHGKKIDESGWHGPSRILGSDPSVMFLRYPHRPYDEIDSDERWDRARPALEENWEEIWIEAGNLVQWKGR